MNHFSLFSGVGGFDLAAEWMGWQNVGHCEIEPFPSHVLKHYFPSSHQYGDIRQLDGTKYRGQIDVLTGGFPCQPFSTAGRRRGAEDNRFLWPEMLRVIREMQPAWIVAENVRGIVSIDGGMVFERVCSELEAHGYEVQPFCIPACAIGAPHKRERMWFIAHAKSDDGRGNARELPQEDEQRREERQNERTTKPCRTNQYTTSNRPSIECERRECSGSGCGESKKEARNGNCDASDSRCERRNAGTGESVGPAGKEPEPTDTRNGHWSRETWLQAATRLCRVDDGFSRRLDVSAFPIRVGPQGKVASRWRKESLKSYGNAIVPQVAYQIFLAIQAASDQEATGA